MKPIQVNKKSGVRKSSPEKQKKEEFKQQIKPNINRQEQSEDEICLFCLKYDKLSYSKIDFASLLNRALATKYSSKPKHAFSQDISDLIDGTSLKWVIDFKYQVFLDDKEEYLKRYYYDYEISQKQNQLVEYYKYHRDIPRFFLKEIQRVVLFFHEKKKFSLYLQYQASGVRKNKKNIGASSGDRKETDLQSSFKLIMKDDHIGDLENVKLLEGITLTQKHSELHVTQSQISTKSILKLLIQNIDDDNANNDAVYLIIYIFQSESWHSFLKSDEKKKVHTIQSGRKLIGLPDQTKQKNSSEQISLKQQNLEVQNALSFKKVQNYTSSIQQIQMKQLKNSQQNLKKFERVIIQTLDGTKKENQAEKQGNVQGAQQKIISEALKSMISSQQSSPKFRNQEVHQNFFQKLNQINNHYVKGQAQQSQQAIASYRKEYTTKSYNSPEVQSRVQTARVLQQKIFYLARCLFKTRQQQRKTASQSSSSRHRSIYFKRSRRQQDRKSSLC